METIVTGNCCSVPKCGSFASENVFLHYFPLKDAALLEKWQQVLRIKKPIRKTMAVCSRHFLDDDYETSPKNTRRRRLKNSAVPSQNLPAGKEDTKNFIRKLRGTKRRNDDEIFKKVKEIKTEVKNEALERQILEKHAEAVSTSTNPTRYNLLDLLRDDKSLNTFTGVDHKTLNDIAEKVRNVLTVLRDDSFSDITPTIIMVLIRLKLKLSFSCLAILFNVSNSTMCSIKFFDMLWILHEAVEEIDWPSKNKILGKMQKYMLKDGDDINNDLD